ncbi:MAG: protein NO VEIN domain-containing protein [Solirubrobacteraceae bacterium]
MNIRDKSIITGLYLSKYSQEGLNELGFKSFQQAFNVLGFSLGSKPASLKNYRDEFDPLFPNDRKGWHKRAIREYCKNYYNEFQNISFSVFSDLIKSFFIENYELENFVRKIEKKDYSESIAKRLLTGKAAEEYFKLEYNKIEVFKSYSILDSTQMACGFDYKLSNLNNFYCIEVKGLNDAKGNIQLTEKEFNVAKNLKLKYCLFMVTNFKDKPIHDFIFDPLNSRLQFKEIKKEIIQITYNTSI